jgi:tetratricopeptide (TPR) repeat protein
MALDSSGLLEKAQLLFKTLTSAVTSLAVLSGAGWIVSTALTKQPVLIERIDLPGSLEGKGDKSEVVLQQILDEVRTLQEISRAERTGSAFFDKSLSSSQKIDANLGGLSIANIEKVTRAVLGTQPKIITGEIILAGTAGTDQLFDGRLRVDNVVISRPTGVAGEQALIRRLAYDLFSHFEPFGAALSAYRRQDYESARASLRQVIAQGSADDRKHALWLRAKLSGRLQEEADLLEALQIDPDFHLALVSLVDLRRREGQFGEALALADRAIAANKDSPYGYHEKGRVLRTQRKFDEAIQQFEIACAQKQKYAPCFNQMGEAMLQKQENAPREESLRAMRTAYEAFVKAMRIDAQHMWAHSNAAYAATNLGNNGDALSLINRALFLDPNLLTNRIRYAYVLYRSGKREEALTLARAILAENPGIYQNDTLGYGSRGAMRVMLPGT